MKERPILFNAPMVRAILDGRKTQTRRVAKRVNFISAGGATMEFSDDDIRPVPCPYGEPGDRLWVREAFDFLPSGGPDEPQACEIVYWATGSHEPRTAPSGYNPMIYGHEKVRPSIHMPRWASRITLEVTGVRVERLQDISEADAMAEGISSATFRPDDGWPLCTGYMVGKDDGKTALQTSVINAYKLLWESINGPGSWDLNSWVWVVEFKRLPEDRK